MEPTRKIKRETAFLVIVAVLFVAAQLVFFPSIYSSSDEHHFLANTFQIQRGYLGEEDPERVCSSNAYGDNGYLYGQYIGRSIFTIPFSWFGLNAVMFSGTIIHLVNLAILVLLLRKLKINELFALLYLFFPVIFWQSRTLYAGILVLTFFLSAFYFYTSKKEKHFVLAGVLFGLAMLVRYDAALGVGAIFLALLLKDRRKLLFVLAGFLPVLMLILGFNSLTYGGVLSTGYGATGTSLLASTVLGLNLFDFLFYVGMFLLVFPLMLLSPYLHRATGKAKRFPFELEFAFFSLAYLVLATRYPPFAFNNSIYTILLRMRYALPLAGMLLVPYAFFLQNLFEILGKNRETGKIMFAGAIVVLLVGSIFASSVHNSLVSGRKAVFDQLYENTPKGSLVIGSSDDCIYFLNELFEERSYLSVDLESQLAGNPEELKLEDFINENTYVMDLRYGNRQGNDSIRQDTINAEREKIDDFISENSSNLELVFESKQPHSLKLYRWAE